MKIIIDDYDYRGSEESRIHIACPRNQHIPSARHRVISRQHSTEPERQDAKYRRKGISEISKRRFVCECLR